MKSQKHRRYHSPDRRPIVGVAVELKWDGGQLCGEVHTVAVGQYHSLDGKKPVAFTMSDWDEETGKAVNDRT